MEKAKKILLLRHGNTQAGQNGLLLGASDVPLAENALAEFDRVREQIAAAGPLQVLCSPLLRARQTAQALQDALPPDHTVQIDPRLREIDFGRWELRSFAAISRDDGPLVRAWQEDYEGFVFPEGEAVCDFVARIRLLYQELLTGSASGGCLLVTHGGVIRTMLCLALGLPLAKYLLFAVQPARLTTLDLFSGGGVLTGLNC